MADSDSLSCIMSTSIDSVARLPNGTRQLRNEYCPDSECPFCPQHLRTSGSNFDQVLAYGPKVHLLPALGMLVPGYLLVATEDHVLSTAELGPSALGDLAQWLNLTVERLGQEFGHYFIFEHGSSGSEASGACVGHAHLHLVPLADELFRHLKTAAPWRKLADYESLAAFVGHGYAYLAVDGNHLVLPEPRLGSQWVRRQIGEWLGRPDWDWALYRGDSELEYTLRSLCRVTLPAAPITRTHRAK
jgi:diadenosine tetraphosphate (Ap4A) HIT family hydrolase